MQDICAIIEKYQNLITTCEQVHLTLTSVLFNLYFLVVFSLNPSPLGIFTLKTDKTLFDQWNVIIL